MGHASEFQRLFLLCVSLKQMVNVIYLLYNKFMYSRSKKTTTTYFNTNYRTEMKLVPIIMDHCLLVMSRIEALIHLLNSPPVKNYHPSSHK